MNKYQRIILILGAFFLIIAIWDAPIVHYGPNGTVIEGESMVVIQGEGRVRLAGVIDFKTAIARSLGVAGATFLLFFAFKGIGKKEQKSEGQKEGAK